MSRATVTAPAAMQQVPATGEIPVVAPAAGIGGNHALAMALASLTCGGSSGGVEAQAVLRPGAHGGPRR